MPFRIILKKILIFYKPDDSQHYFGDDISHATFDGNIDMEKLENLFAQITSENLIKKLPQHESMV